jgi:tetratricopeptide (TPR) repeat protein
MMRRSVVVPSLARGALVAALGLALAATPSLGQLARPRVAAPDAPKMLVLPFQRENADSAMSLLIADGVRDRLRSNHNDKFNSLTRAQLNQALLESGYPVDVPLDAATSRQLVRFLNAKFVIEANLIRRPGDSLLVIARLAEASGADPQAATASLMVATARAGTGTGAEAVNRLIDGYETFEKVTECRRKLDLRDYLGAQRAATDALRNFPNNAGAWVCIARIREAQNAPVDSVTKAYRNAFDRDTLNTVVQRRLAARYEAAADTASLLPMLKRILTIDFRDNDLRIRTIRLMVQMGQVDTAIAWANLGLRENPASSELLGVKAIAMAAGSHWDSAFATMQLLSEVDSGKVDSAFVYRTTNYARQIPDTTGWMRWVQTATQRYPTQLPYWYTLASVRLVKGDSTGAMEAARGLLGQLPPGADTSSVQETRQYFGRAHYIIAMVMNGRAQADSAVAHIAQALHADSTLRPQAAIVYLQAGLKSYRDSSYVVAIERLQKAKDFAQGRAVIPAAFFLGLSQVQYGRQLDTQVEASRSCDDVRKLGDLWTAAEQNIIAGVAQNREVSNQLLSQVIPAYKQRAEAMTRNFCH